MVVRHPVSRHVRNFIPPQRQTDRLRLRLRLRLNLFSLISMQVPKGPRKAQRYAGSQSSFLPAYRVYGAGLLNLKFFLTVLQSGHLTSPQKSSTFTKKIPFQKK